MTTRRTQGRSRRALLVALMAAIVGSCSPKAARADRPLAEDPDDISFYGWQNAVVDAGAASLVIVGVMRQKPALVWIGGVSSVFGSGIVHAAHGNFDSALVSAGLRGIALGVAYASAALVELSACDPNENDHALGLCRDRGKLGASSAGLALAALADDFFFARSRRTAARPVLLPYGSVVRLPGGGAPTFGVSGTF